MKNGLYKYEKDIWSKMLRADKSFISLFIIVIDSCSEDVIPRGVEYILLEEGGL